MAGRLPLLTPWRTSAFPVPHYFPGCHEFLNCGSFRKEIPVHLALLVGLAVGVLQWWGLSRESFRCSSFSSS